MKQRIREEAEARRTESEKTQRLLLERIAYYDRKFAEEERAADERTSS